MLASPQFLLDEQGQPKFAILAYNDYLKLSLASGVSPAVRQSLLSKDRKTVSLPNGGQGASIDLVQFADYCDRKGLIDLAINQRAQSLDRFPTEQWNTLDPFIRRNFLPLDSPYRNTMQATTEVVDALVESGLFTRTRQSYDYFYRPVNALKVNTSALIEYIKEMGRPWKKIPINE